MNFLCKSSSDKKSEILNAVIEIIGKEGIAALTHRNVAQKAGVSLSATTYYFKSKEDMVIQGFEMLIDEHVKSVENILNEIKNENPDIDSILHRELHENLLKNPEEKLKIIAIYELMIEAMRNSRYQELIAKWHNVNIKLLSIAIKDEYLNFFSMFEIYSVFNGIVFHILSGGGDRENPIPNTKKYLKSFCEIQAALRDHA